MSRTLITAGLLVLALALLGLPLEAGVFETWTVELKSGEKFQTRYEPEEASWDAEVLMLLTEVGNWIALSRQDVVSVSSFRDSVGYGIRLDANTLQLGLVANDGDEEGGKRGALEALPQDTERSYDLQQFVEPGQAGQGGIPVYGFGNPFAFDTSGGAAAPPPSPPPGG